MKCKTRIAAAIVSAAATVGAVAGPAAAATINTYMLGFRAGDSSGHWSDNNTGSGTSIRLENCRTRGSQATKTFSNVVLTLWRQRGALPDETRGDKTYYCYYGVTQSWTTPSADVYYFEVRQIWNQENQACTINCVIDANPVTITY